LLTFLNALQISVPTFKIHIYKITKCRIYKKKIFTSNASCRAFFFSKLVDGNAVFSSSKIIIYLNYLCTFIPDSSICPCQNSKSYYVRYNELQFLFKCFRFSNFSFLSFSLYFRLFALNFRFGILNSVCSLLLFRILFPVWCSVPPSVRADPADGNYVVKKGHRVELRCSASGNPHPSIRWARKVTHNYSYSTVTVTVQLQLQYSDSYSNT